MLQSQEVKRIWPTNDAQADKSTVRSVLWKFSQKLSKQLATRSPSSSTPASEPAPISLKHYVWGLRQSL